MLKNEKISATQFGVLVFLYSVGSTILLSPSGMAGIAKEDGWIAAIAGVTIGFLFVLLFTSLSKQFPKKTFVQYSEEILGKWLGKFVSILFVTFSFIGAATVLYHMGNFMAAQIMPATPTQVFNVTFALIIMFSITLGLEVFARTAETFLPWVVALFLLMSLSVTPEIDITNVQPMLLEGIAPIIKAALSFASVNSLPCIVFSMISPSVDKPENVRKAFLLGMLFGGLFIVIIIFLSLTVLGVYVSANTPFPSYVLAKKINVGQFLTRIEVIVAILWFITIYYKVLLYFYASVLGITQIFELQSVRPILFPLTVLLIISSVMIYPNTVYAAEWDSTIWVAYAFTFGLLLPLLLLIIAKIRF